MWGRRETIWNREKIGWLSIAMIVSSIVALGMGFYKMFVYKSSESIYGEKTNAYVGGDAYNYIINGTYATGYFVLFGALLISGLLIELILSIRESFGQKNDSPATFTVSASTESDDFSGNEVKK